MFKFFLAIFLAVFVLQNSQAQKQKIIELPVTVIDGYGPFQSGMGIVGVNDTNNIENSWHTTYLRIKGFPKHWKNYFYGKIETDFYQWTYQNYRSGKIPLQDYKELQEAWKWVPDLKSLSAKPIKCYVHCAWNIDEDGHMGEVILDKNNNLDFSDDTVFTVKNSNKIKWDEAAKKPLYFNAEKFEKGKIISVDVPLILALSPPHIYYSIPQYGKAIFKAGKNRYNIAINPGFSRTDFSHAEIYQIYDTSKAKIDDNLLINENEYISLGDKTYKNLGVKNMKLQLQKIPENIEVFSTQVGYRAFPFSAKEFSDSSHISLDKYKGKYVFVDFWGTWCQPCVEEIPNMKKAYETCDSNKIQFISIARDNPERLRNFIEKENLKWPQILSDKETKIIETYNIESYPTTLLIDPTGKIIAKNLRGENLAEKIKELIKE